MKIKITANFLVYIGDELCHGRKAHSGRLYQAVDVSFNNFFTPFLIILAPKNEKGA